MTGSVERSRVLIARGESGEAEALLDAHLQEHPDDEEALLLQAALLLEQRRDEAALLDFRHAVAVAPDSARAANGLARCLHALGRDEEALRAAERGRELLQLAANGSEAGPVYLTLLWCLRALRRLPEAAAVAEEGLARTPDVVLAQWANVVEEELAEASQERC
jgi:tetratricopeptide (TPR) repeat protein